MRAIPDRRTWVHAVVAIAACLALWKLAVEPHAMELRRLDAEIERATEAPTAVGQERIERMAERLAEARSAVREVRHRGRFADDSASIYGRVMDLAEHHGVVVRQLSPAVPRTGSDGPRDLRIVGFEMTLEGDYERTAAFLQALNNLNGFVRTSRVRMSPLAGDGDATVRTEYAGEAVRFIVPQTLTAMIGGDDAEP